MKISDQVVLAAKNLARRPGRTALTLIGVVIGTCLVVVLISMGIAQNQAQEEMLASWGDLTQIEVYGSGYLDNTEIPLDDAAVESFTALGHVVAATPYAYAWSLNGTITAGRGGRYSTYLGNMMAVYPDALEPMGFALSEGSWLPEGAANPKDKTIPVLVCEGTAYNFEDTRKSYSSPNRYRYMGQTDAAGNELPPFFDIDKETMTLTLSDGGENAKTASWELEVVGKLVSDPAKGWWTQSGIVIRIQDLKMLQAEYKDLVGDRSTGQSGYDQVYVKVDEVDNVDDVEAALKEMGFTNLWSMSQQRESMRANVIRSQMIMGGVAAVSLLVAAINIINTMTMAIYERTREIGVMKVLGCELGAIRQMFLFESGFIGLLGGVVGCGISLLVSLVMNNLTTLLGFFGRYLDLYSLLGDSAYYMGDSSRLSIIPWWLLAGALAFATLIGLVAGVLPANRAVRISALEAIRHE